MSKSNYFLIFYNSYNKNYIEQLSKTFYKEISLINTDPLIIESLDINVPDNMILHQTGLHNIFFLEDKNHTYSIKDISRFYKELIKLKNGSNYKLFDDMLYIYQVDDIYPVL